MVHNYTHLTFYFVAVLLLFTGVGSERSPCFHGRLRYAGHGTFLCDCYVGWSGIFCEREIISVDALLDSHTAHGVTSVERQTHKTRKGVSSYNVKPNAVAVTEGKIIKNTLKEYVITMKTISVSISIVRGTRIELPLSVIFSLQYEKAGGWMFVKKGKPRLDKTHLISTYHRVAQYVMMIRYQHKRIYNVLSISRMANYYKNMVYQYRVKPSELTQGLARLDKTKHVGILIFIHTHPLARVIKANRIVHATYRYSSNRVLYHKHFKIAAAVKLYTEFSLKSISSQVIPYDYPIAGIDRDKKLGMTTFVVSKSVLEYVGGAAETLVFHSRAGVWVKAIDTSDSRRVAQDRELTARMSVSNDMNLYVRTYDKWVCSQQFTDPTTVAFEHYYPIELLNPRTEYTITNQHTMKYTGLHTLTEANDYGILTTSRSNQPYHLYGAFMAHYSGKSLKMVSMNYFLRMRLRRNSGRKTECESRKCKSTQNPTSEEMVFGRKSGQRAERESSKRKRSQGQISEEYMVHNPYCDTIYTGMMLDGRPIIAQDGIVWVNLHTRHTSTEKNEAKLVETLIMVNPILQSRISLIDSERQDGHEMVLTRSFIQKTYDNSKYEKNIMFMVESWIQVFKYPNGDTTQRNFVLARMLLKSHVEQFDVVIRKKTFFISVKRQIANTAVILGYVARYKTIKRHRAYTPHPLTYFVNRNNYKTYNIFRSGVLRRSQHAYVMTLSRYSSTDVIKSSSLNYRAFFYPYIDILVGWHQQLLSSQSTSLNIAHTFVMLLIESIPIIGNVYIGKEKNSKCLTFGTETKVVLTDHSTTEVIIRLKKRGLGLPKENSTSRRSRKVRPSNSNENILREVRNSRRRRLEDGGVRRRGRVRMSKEERMRELKNSKRRGIEADYSPRRKRIKRYSKKTDGTHEDHLKDFMKRLKKRKKQKIIQHKKAVNKVSEEKSKFAVVIPPKSSQMPAMMVFKFTSPSYDTFNIVSQDRIRYRKTHIMMHSLTVHTCVHTRSEPIPVVFNTGSTLVVLNYGMKFRGSKINMRFSDVIVAANNPTTRKLSVSYILNVHNFRYINIDQNNQLIPSNFYDTEAFGATKAVLSRTERNDNTGKRVPTVYLLGLPMSHQLQLKWFGWKTESKMMQRITTVYSIYPHLLESTIIMLKSYSEITKVDLKISPPHKHTGMGSLQSHFIFRYYNKVSKAHHPFRRIHFKSENLLKIAGFNPHSFKHVTRVGRTFSAHKVATFRHKANYIFIYNSFMPQLVLLEKASRSDIKSTVTIENLVKHHKRINVQRFDSPTIIKITQIRQKSQRKQVKQSRPRCYHYDIRSVNFPLRGEKGGRKGNSRYTEDDNSNRRKHDKGHDGTGVGGQRLRNTVDAAKCTVIVSSTASQDMSMDLDSASKFRKDDIKVVSVIKALRKSKPLLIVYPQKPPVFKTHSDVKKPHSAKFFTHSKTDVYYQHRLETKQLFYYNKKSVRTRRILKRINASLVSKIRHLSVRFHTFSIQKPRYHRSVSNLHTVNLNQMASFATISLIRKPEISKLDSSSQEIVKFENKMKRFGTTSSVSSQDTQTWSVPKEDSVKTTRYNFPYLSLHKPYPRNMFSVSSTSHDYMLKTRSLPSSQSTEFYYGYGYTGCYSHTSSCSSLSGKSKQSSKVSYKKRRDNGQSKQMSKGGSKINRYKDKSTSKSTSKKSTSSKTSNQPQNTGLSEYQNPFNCPICQNCLVYSGDNGRQYQVSKVKLYNYCPPSSADNRKLNLKKRGERTVHVANYCIHGIEGPYFWIMPFTNYFIIWGYDLNSRSLDLSVFYDFYNWNYKEYTYRTQPAIYKQYIKSNRNLYPRRGGRSYSNLKYDERYPVTFCVCSFYYNIRMSLTYPDIITKTTYSTYSYKITFTGSTTSAMSIGSIGYNMHSGALYKIRIRYILKPMTAAVLSTSSLGLPLVRKSSSNSIGTTFILKFGGIYGIRFRSSKTFLQQVTPPFFKLADSYVNAHQTSTFSSRGDSLYWFILDTGVQTTRIRGIMTPMKLTPLRISRIVALPTTYVVETYSQYLIARTRGDSTAKVSYHTHTSASSQIIEKENKIVRFGHNSIAAHTIKISLSRSLTSSSHKSELSFMIPQKGVLGWSVDAASLPVFGKSVSKQAMLYVSRYSFDRLRQVWLKGIYSILRLQYTGQSVSIVNVKMSYLSTLTGYQEKHTMSIITSASVAKEIVTYPVKNVVHKTLSKSTLLTVKKAIKFNVLVVVIFPLEVRRYTIKNVVIYRKSLTVTQSDEMYATASSRVVQVEEIALSSQHRSENKHGVEFSFGHASSVLNYEHSISRRKLQKAWVGLMVVSGKHMAIFKTVRYQNSLVVSEFESNRLLQVFARTGCAYNFGNLEKSGYKITKRVWEMVQTRVTKEKKHTLKKLHDMDHSVRKLRSHKLSLDLRAAHVIRVSQKYRTVIDRHSIGRVLQFIALGKGFRRKFQEIRFASGQVKKGMVRKSSGIQTATMKQLSSHHSTEDKHYMEYSFTRALLEINYYQIRGFHIERKQSVSWKSKAVVSFGVSQRTSHGDIFRFGEFTGTSEKEQLRYAYAVVSYSNILNTDSETQDIVWAQVKSAHLTKNQHVFEHTVSVTNNHSKTRYSRILTKAAAQKSIVPKKNKVYVIKKSIYRNTQFLVLYNAGLIKHSSKRFTFSYTVNRAYDKTKSNISKVWLVSLAQHQEVIDLHTIQYSSTKLRQQLVRYTSGEAWFKRKMLISTSTKKAGQTPVTPLTKYSNRPVMTTSTTKSVIMYDRYYFTVARMNQYLQTSEEQTFTDIVLRTNKVVIEKHSFKRSHSHRTSYGIVPVFRKHFSYTVLRFQKPISVRRAYVKEKGISRFKGLYVDEFVYKKQFNIFKKFIFSSVISLSIDSSSGKTSIVLTKYFPSKHSVSKKKVLTQFYSRQVASPSTFTKSEFPKKSDIMISFKTQRVGRKPVTTKLRTTIVFKFDTDSSNEIKSPQKFALSTEKYLETQVGNSVSKRWTVYVIKTFHNTKPKHRIGYTRKHHKNLAIYPLTRRPVRTTRQVYKKILQIKVFTVQESVKKIVKSTLFNTGIDTSSKIGKKFEKSISLKVLYTKSSDKTVMVRTNSLNQKVSVISKHETKHFFSRTVTTSETAYPMFRGMPPHFKRLLSTETIRFESSALTSSTKKATFPPPTTSVSTSQKEVVKIMMLKRRTSKYDVTTASKLKHHSRRSVKDAAITLLIHSKTYNGQLRSTTNIVVITKSSRFGQKLLPVSMVRYMFVALAKQTSSVNGSKQPGGLVDQTAVSVPPKRFNIKYTGVSSYIGYQYLQCRVYLARLSKKTTYQGIGLKINKKFKVKCISSKKKGSKASLASPKDLLSSVKSSIVKKRSNVQFKQRISVHGTRNDISITTCSIGHKFEQLKYSVSNPNSKMDNSVQVFRYELQLAGRVLDSEPVLWGSDGLPYEKLTSGSQVKIIWLSQRNFTVDDVERSSDPMEDTRSYSYNIHAMMPISFVTKKAKS